jgi:LysR family transcriptional regulator, transcriptional activator of nhaA
MKKLEDINFHHLFYFWTVATEGSVTAAGRRLGLAQPSVSAQVRKLEEALGADLFEKQGRGRLLTDMGRDVLRHAEQVFGSAQNLVDFLNGRRLDDASSIAVGIPDVMSRLVAHRLMAPLYLRQPQLSIECRGSNFEDLLSDLAISRFDVVLSHAPMASHLRIKAFNHKLGESELTVFAPPAIAARCGTNFPESLDGLPILLPVAGTELRRSLDQWFDEYRIRPYVAGEFSDSALMKEFGAGGAGAFVAPSVVEAKICKQYGVEPLGRLTDLSEQFYAITTNKRIVHPGVAMIIDAARAHAFAA